MEPRLVFSLKYVPFPPELMKQVEEQFRLNFLEALNGQELILEGRIYEEEVFFRVGFKAPNELRQHNFLTSQVFEPKQALQAVYECVDGASSLLEWFLEDKNSEKIPQVWSEFEFGDLKIYGQYSTYNDELERVAQSLLSSNSETGLLKAEPSDTDNEENAIYEAIVQDIMDQLKH